MEWNNHPFEKDTPVRTFGSGSELATWDAENCDRCIKHEECELCDAITAAYLGDGRIPLWVAKQIGCQYDPLYLTATLGKTCRERRTEEQRDFPLTLKRDEKRKSKRVYRRMYVSPRSRYVRARQMATTHGDGKRC